jgi:hypothetical protein
VGLPESGYFKESPETAAPHAISFWYLWLAELPLEFSPPPLFLQEQEKAAFFPQGLSKQRSWQLPLLPEYLSLGPELLLAEP